jgi:alpha-glucosidase (family GH31 glycosyl hydrolase)
MDIYIDNEGGQYLEYNIIGGVLDFYFIAGPSPRDVATQYAEITQLPLMSPYWGLGFHQCRYGYQDVYNVAAVVANYSEAGIPLETMWTDSGFTKSWKCQFEADGTLTHCQSTTWTAAESSRSTQRGSQLI